MTNIIQLLQELHFYIWLVSGQNPGSVKVIEKFSAKFEIELVAILFNAFKYCYYYECSGIEDDCKVD